MNINRLRYLAAVAETGSIRRAAELLDISPAALSKALATLERETGQQLLVPAGRGIRLTQFARTLAQRAVPVLEQLSSLERDLAQQDLQPETLVRIGTFETFSTYLLGAMAERLADLRLAVYSYRPGDVEAAVADGVVDVGITYSAAPTAGVEHVRAGTLEMVTAAREDRLGSVPFAELPFAAPVRTVAGSLTRTHSADGWPDETATRTVRYRVASMESALELARRGYAAAFVPRCVLQLHNEQVADHLKLQVVRHPPRLGRQTKPVFVVRRSDQPLARVAFQLAGALQEVTGATSRAAENSRASSAAAAGHAAP